MATSRIQSTSLTLAAADADGISTSQTPSGAGNLTITGALASGGVATMDIQRKVLFTFAADESAKTFVVTGTNQFGVAISETVTGTDSTAITILDYKTVSQISVSAALTGAVTVGTTTKASSVWIPVRSDLELFLVSCSCEISSGGSLTYTLQHCIHADPPNEAATATTLTVFNNDDSSLVNATTSKVGNYIVPITAVRVNVTAFTSGTVTLKVMQAGKDR